MPLKRAVILLSLLGSVVAAAKILINASEGLELLELGITLRIRDHLNNVVGALHEGSDLSWPCVGRLVANGNVPELSLHERLLDAHRPIQVNDVAAFLEKCKATEPRHPSKNEQFLRAERSHCHSNSRRD